jgi:serine/threonine protein kinase
VSSEQEDLDRLGLARTFAGDAAAQAETDVRPVVRVGRSGPHPGQSGQAGQPEKAARSEPSPPSGLVDQRIGSYRVVRELGRGGMGVVYEVVHEQLGQRAVVKTLQPELSHNQSFTQRFLTEARAISIAQHPGLVKIFDFGQLPDKTLYILMEHLAGEPLSARLTRQKLDEPTALRLGRQVASTLQAAHERGVIHRDLKPANIFIVPDPEAPAGERVKLLDFGLAKISEGLPGSDLRGTASGTIMGTPLYMSPEQCRGLANTDGKTDVYSLGVLLFEMLAGDPPFLADSAGDLIAMHIRETAPSLHKRVLVSGATAALVAGMLAKDPAARPTMAQVVERLQQAERAWRPPRSSSKRRIGGALAACVLLGAGLFLALRSHRAPVPRAQTVASSPTGARTVWSLTSAPSGAEVVRVEDQVGLGLTPWRHEQDARPGELEVVLRYPGHASQRLVLDGKVSTERHVVLAPVPPPSPEPVPEPPRPEPPPASAAEAEPARPQRRGARGSRKGASSVAAVPAAPAPPAASAEPKPPVSAPPARPAPPDTPHEDVDVPVLR